MHLRAVALGIFWLSLVGTSPHATPTPTAYRPTFAETLHRTLSDGVYGAPAGTTPVGGAIEGFALSLTANRYTFRFGEGLSFAVELRNVSNVSKSTPFSAQDVIYEFIAANKNNENATEGQAAPNFGPPAGYEFAPRTSLYLWFEPQVTDTMQEPGTFTVQVQVVVHGRRLVSNIVTLNILPSSDGRPSYASSDPSRSSPSGPAESNLALAISKSSAASVYRVGSPMWVTVEVRNTGPPTIALINVFTNSYATEVVDRSSGRRLQLPQNWEERLDALSGGFGSQIVPNGESHFQAIRLDRLFDRIPQGRYSVRVKATLEVQPEGGSPWPPRAHVTLQSNALQIEVLPARSPTVTSARGSDVYEGEPGAQPAGPAANGFALSLANTWPNDSLGGPILVSVELRNVSGNAQDAFFGSPSSDYSFTIVNRQTGAAVGPRPNVPSQSSAVPKSWSSRPIYPDTSLFSQFALHRLYDFTEGGTYTIRATGQPIINGRRVTLQSNPVEVTLAAPPPRVALPTMDRVLSFKIQTDRPVYTAGEPVLVRLVITNLGKEPVAYDPNSPQPPCILNIVNDRNEPVFSPQGGHGRRPARGVTAMPRLSVGTTTLRWSQIGAWGFFHPLERGTYTITCRPEIYGYIFTPNATYTLTGDNATTAPALKIQILTEEAARTEPAYKLDDPSVDATFRSLIREYARLRSGVRGFVTQLQSGAPQGALFSKNPNWESDQEELGQRISRLPSSGNPDSPYVLLTANFQRAVSELGTAGDSALHWCDPPSAGADLRVADYFFDAVRRELSNGETNAGDAAYPPSEASPRGYCR